MANELMSQIGQWLADGMLRGDPLALAAAVILVPIGAILGLTTL
ncbi:hypothetical protein [Nocardia carnea]|nr:hypothetical protein [Nocardia carnea]